MRVLHILPKFTTGGMENQVRRLARELHGTGVICHVHSCCGGDPTLWTGEDFPMSFDAGARGIAGRIYRTMRLIREMEPEIVHVHLSLSGYIAAKLGGASKVVSHYHAVYPPPGEMRARDLLLWKAVDRLCSGDFSLACSKAVREQCISKCGISPDRVGVIYNGLDIAGFDELATLPDNLSREGLQGRPTMVFVGRLVAAKGLEDLIASLATLSTREWKLSVVGDGPLRDRLQESVQAHGLNGNITFYGMRPWHEVPAILARSDIFIHPSRWEGLGLSIIEASACRLPVIATNIGGIPEVVIHGETGLLVRPGDAAALAGSIARLLADAELRREMGQAGRRIVERLFNIETIAKRLIDIYDQVLSSDRPLP